MAHKRLFHRRVIGSADQSVDCWYLIIADDRTCHIQHMWEHADGANEPTIGSTTMDVEHFMETTLDLEVLGSLCAILKATGHIMATATHLATITEGRAITHHDVM